jgi:alkylated DNA nucleotide flippase Atl1
MHRADHFRDEPWWRVVCVDGTLNRARMTAGIAFILFAMLSTSA